MTPQRVAGGLDLCAGDVALRVGLACLLTRDGEHLARPGDGLVGGGEFGACLASAAEPGLVESLLRGPLCRLGLFHGIVGRIEFGIERRAHRVRIGDPSCCDVDDLDESALWSSVELSSASRAWR